MKRLLFTVLACITLFSCTKTNKEWQQFETIELGKITPIGFAFVANNIWIADGDHNQLVEVDEKGEILNTAVGFERPMHIDSKDGVLYIPEYGSDQIIKYGNGKRDILSLSDSLDAPAGVAVFNQEIAIADFYNHRIVYFDGQKWFSFGKEGKIKGELYYPTDVQILTDKIVVADAYNNRIQIFDKSGNSLKIIGEEEKMNAATGLYADDSEIWITDFENDRVLVFDHDGNVQQIITQGLSKPTEILKVGKMVYIANYKGKNFSTFKQK